MKIIAYPPVIEAQMLNFYNSLSEKDRRRYAAIEATKLGHGGATYIRRVLHCNDRTITRGQQELQTELSRHEQRIRRPGAGRKSVLSQTKGLSDAFLDVINNHTAGSPMDETIKWTNLSRPAIAQKLEEQGFTLLILKIQSYRLLTSILRQKRHPHSLLIQRRIGTQLTS